jgi:hypothetical protein
MSLKTIAIAVMAAVVFFAAGWLTGSSKTAMAERAKSDAEFREDFTAARLAIVQGQVSVYKNDFGEGMKHFADGRAAVDRLEARFKASNQAGNAGDLSKVTSHLHDAEHLTAEFETTKAEDAAQQALLTLARLTGTPLE